MKSYKQFITEKHTSTLFHLTRISRGVSIISDMEFRPSSISYGESIIISRALHNGSRDNVKHNETRRWLEKRGYQYYMSFARDTVNQFFNEYKIDSVASIVFEINARELSKYGKIIPVNFWSTAPGGQGLESEDRLLTREAKIPIAKMLKSITVYNMGTRDPYARYPKEEMQEILDQIKRDLERHGVGHIPVKYKTRK
jgi:hypothetical protein